jgi:hypothetical protein
MPGQLEKAVLDLVEQITGGSIQRQASEYKWLGQIGLDSCGTNWKCICDIYRDLTNQNLPELMLPWKRRVDGILRVGSSCPRIVEIDECQHFNCYRASTFRFYSSEVPIAFDRDIWIRQSLFKKRLEGGKFGIPKPPLFDLEQGRHRERAFRDALCDLLPSQHGFLPTLRIGHFEVPWDRKNKTWLNKNDARKDIEDLLKRRIVN